MAPGWCERLAPERMGRLKTWYGRERKLASCRVEKGEIATRSGQPAHQTRLRLERRDSATRTRTSCTQAAWECYSNPLASSSRAVFLSILCNGHLRIKGVSRA